MLYPSKSSVIELCSFLDMSEKLTNTESIQALRKYIKIRTHTLIHPHPNYDIRRWPGKPMYHPDMLTLHQARVSMFAQELGEYLKIPKINNDYLAVLGLHHDSPEFISPFGDVPTPLKMKLQGRNLQTFRMIDEITERYTERVIGLKKGFYAEYSTMQHIEHQLNKLSDMLDSNFYAVMEAQLGNTLFEEKLHGASHGRLNKLAVGELLPKINFRQHAQELIDFTQDIHTNSPPLLYTLWRQVHRRVQDDIDRRVKIGELPMYPDGVMEPIIPKKIIGKN